MDLDLDLIRKIARWIAFVSILIIIIIVVRPYLVQPEVPPVQMPGGDIVADGVSTDLDAAFATLLGVDNAARLHFVVQFNRELTATEIDNFSAQNGLVLDGPIPENAYVTSMNAGNWLRTRDMLLATQPGSTKIFELRRQDRLSPRIRRADDPAIVEIPEYARVILVPNPNNIDPRAEIFVRFHDDVPFARQRQILVDEQDATQPDGSPVTLGPSGIWAISLPEANVDPLSDYDEVRFIEPKMPPVELDIDQARLEVGAGTVAYDGAGVMIAQWEQCQVSTLHLDMAGRATPVGPITIACRKWQFKDIDQNGQYDSGELLGVDLDEDGTVETIIHDGGLQVPVDIMWEELPLRISLQSGRRYIKYSGDLDHVEFGDTLFLVNTVDAVVSPFTDNNLSNVDHDLVPLHSERHPTLVAGILVSNSLSQTTGGVPRYPGLLPAANVRSYEWRHDTVISDYVDAMAHGARISTNSFGWQGDYPFSIDPDPYVAMSQTYDELASGRTETGAQSGMPRRMLIVASVGNAGHHDDFWSTARVVNSTKNVISVGNVSSANELSPPDGLGFPSQYSSRGPTMVGGLAPILTAPGTQMNCVEDGGDWDCDAPDGDGGITSTEPIDSYGPESGTSFSTPIVSGAAAQLGHYFESTCNAVPAPQDLRALLVHSAKDLTWAENLNDAPSDTEWIGPDYIFGYGLLQTDRALELIRNAVMEEIDTGWVEHRILVNDNSQLVDNGTEKDLKVTLVWDDPAYFTEFDPREETGTLHNDLDLEVIDPNGNRHMPWVLGGGADYDGDPASRVSRSKYLYVLDEWRDHRNTIEQVVVSDVTPNLMNRTWTIRVRGNEIRRGPQAYSLVSEAFVALPGTACGDFSNGSTTFVLNPLDLPSTPLFWMLFWIAVIILIWLTFETLASLYETNQNRFTMPILLLMLLFVLLLLFAIFRLLVMDAVVYLAYLMFVSMAYVLWRATQ